MRRAVLATLMCAAVLSASAWGLALDVREPTTVRALPGAYATLAFALIGEGTYDYVVTVPAPWQPLAGSGSVRVDGDGFVSVTLRVPRSLPAGAVGEVEVTFTARDATDDSPPPMRAVGRVEVLPLGAIELVAPAALEGEVATPLRFVVVVRNAGNRPDRVVLSAEQPMWASHVEPSELELGAGEEHEVVVVLEPVGVVSSGYRMTVRLAVASLVDPTVDARTGTAVTLFRAGATAGARPADAPPALTLRVRTGVAAGLTIDEGVSAGSIGYDLVPRLEGELSDYVTVSAGAGGFAGDLEDPFRERPSRLDVALQGATWSAGGSFGDGDALVLGNAAVRDWRVGATTSLGGEDDRRTYSVSVFADSQRPDLDLQFSARTSGEPEGRTDVLSARYRTPLGDALELTVGADLLGRADASGYGVEPVLTEGLAWRAGSFDVAQSYAGLPLAGVHALGVSGGAQVAGVGVRASTTVLFAGDDPRWSASLSLNGTPTAGLGAAVDGSLAATRAATTWTVRPSVTYRVGDDAWSAALAASYAHSGLLRGEAAVGAVVRCSANVRIADLRVTAAASWDLRAQAGVPQRSVAADASVGYRFTSAATFEFAVRYRAALDGEAGPEADWRVAAAWWQEWTPNLETRLSYEQDVRRDATLTARSERLEVALAARDVGLEGLGVTAAYAVSSPTGLLTGVTPLRHDLSLRVGYSLVLPFDTPDPIVAAFGGRRGGVVSGTAFLDRSLDGVRDPGEPGLAGVIVRVGDAQTVTDADGAYHLRVPAGTQAVAFGGGLPSTLLARGPDVLVVEDGVDQRVELPFAPTVRLGVTLFDDLDGDGARSDGEYGIAFGGVLIEGPVRVAARMDARGSADVSGLIPGRYTVRPDPDRLPERYQATAAPVTLVLREGEQAQRVLIGAGAPPRTTVTTFAGAQLAVIARAEPTRSAPGADVDVVALVSGAAERVVVVSLEGNEVELVPDGARWTAVVRLPRDAPPGPNALVVRAEASGRWVEARAAITVVDRPLVEADRIFATVGGVAEARVTVAFAAASVILDFAGWSCPLEGVDGRLWTGTFVVEEAMVDRAVPADESGRIRVEGRVLVDGEDLGTVVLTLRVPQE